MLKYTVIQMSSSALHFVLCYLLFFLLFLFFSNSFSCKEMLLLFPAVMQYKDSFSHPRKWKRARLECPIMQDMFMSLQRHKFSNEHNYTHLYCEKEFILPQRQQICLHKLASIVLKNRCSDLNGKQFKSLAWFILGQLECLKERWRVPCKPQYAGHDYVFARTQTF